MLTFAAFRPPMLVEFHLGYRIMGRLGGRLEDLHQRFVINAQEKMNQRWPT